MDNFLVQKYENNFQTSKMSARFDHFYTVHRNAYSRNVTSVSDQ